MTDRTPAVDAAIEAELRLLAPEVRASPDLLGQLLHPEFTEFGTSGTRWDRASIITALAENTSRTGRSIMTTRMRGVQLADDVVHLTFDTESNGRLAHRSSLWRLCAGEWLLWFHQGTPFGADGPPEA
ncbi:nuclear transport factor 2 family protein [Streptomyces rectiviolaceus]|uniref:Nuclear transport factor 2 family protein n=1 Tax=Streptomyces rectiviolaceus TaxID=332591 RepID=A0ABP6M9U3_9ACTN